MFDLERAIHDWRQALGQAESVSQGNTQELETHLHEGIANLVEKGLSREEAFLVASARLGDHTALNLEFCKVNGMHTWRRRILWMLCGYVGGIALTCAISGISIWVGTMSAFVGFSGASAATAAIFAAVVSWTILLLVLYARARRSDTYSENGYVSSGWLIVLAALAAAGGGMGILGNAVHAQVVPAEKFFESMLWTSLGGNAMRICIAAACIGMILAIRDRSPQQSTLSSQ